MIRILFVLVCLTHVAFAQPSERAPPPSDPPPPPMPVEPMQPPQQQPVDLDAIIAKVQAEQPTLMTVAKGSLRRARRGIAIGPTVGLWSAAFLDPGDTDLALTFGIGIETFKVPVLPDTETLKTLVVERVKAEVKSRVIDVFKGRQMEPFEAEQFVRQVYADVRAEVLGLENVRAKTLERPKYTVGFEANRLFGAERWMGRTRVGLGVWKVTVALSASFGRACRGDGCDDGVKAFVGPEVVLHIIPRKNPRANVIDVFLRSDFQANGRGDTTYDQIVLGTRILLDLI